MPNTPGRRWFLAGSILALLLGAVHSLAVLNALFVPPPPGRAALVEQLKGTTERIGPFTPSAWGTVQILNVSFSILTLGLGALNLLSLGPLAAAGRIRRAAGVNALVMAALVAVCLAFEFPPPAAFALAGLVSFGVAFLRSRPAQPTTGA